MEIKKYELYLEEDKVWDTRNEYQLASNESVICFVKEELKADRWDREKFVVLAVNAKGDLIGYNLASVGELSSSIVSPREIAKFLILANAAAVIFVHNHPSDDVTPSPEDIASTKRLKKVTDLIGIKMLDHIIISKTGSYSFCGAGMME